MLSFFKKEGTWFILPAQNLPHQPKIGADAPALEDTILDFLARGKKTVTLKIDTKPFENAEELQLLELCEAPMGGGYYLLQTLKGRPVHQKFWLCDMLLLLFGDIPEQIYIQRTRLDH